MTLWVSQHLRCLHNLSSDMPRWYHSRHPTARGMVFLHPGDNHHGNLWSQFLATGASCIMIEPEAEAPY